MWEEERGNQSWHQGAGLRKEDADFVNSDTEEPGWEGKEGNYISAMTSLNWWKNTQEEPAERRAQIQDWVEEDQAEQCVTGVKIWSADPWVMGICLVSLHPWVDKPIQKETKIQR